MFSSGSFGELLVVVAAVLILFRPEDFPTLLRKLGQWLGQAKRYSLLVQEILKKDLREGELEDYIRYINKKVSSESVSSDSSTEEYSDPKDPKN